MNDPIVDQLRSIRSTLSHALRALTGRLVIELKIDCAILAT